MNWIIGIGGSRMDNVECYRVSGTTDEVRAHLASRVLEDKDEDPSNWKFGVESANEVENGENGSLYAYGCWNNYHNDYTARPEMEIIEL